MKKELIENNCQFCKHSAKTYLRIGNSLVLKDAAFCMNADLTAKMRALRTCRNIEAGTYERRSNVHKSNKNRN